MPRSAGSGAGSLPAPRERMRGRDGVEYDLPLPRRKSKKANQNAELAHTRQKASRGKLGTATARGEVKRAKDSSMESGGSSVRRLSEEEELPKGGGEGAEKMSNCQRARLGG